MKRFPEDELRDLLAPSTISGPGKHIIGKCPFCGSEDHFYVQRKTDKIHPRLGKNVTGMYNCKKCSQSGMFGSLLKKLGRLDLFGGKKTVDIFGKLEPLVSEKLEVNLFTEKIRPPIGYKRVYDHWYFRNRGFVKEQYEIYNVGVNAIYSKYRDYVFFVIEEDGVPKGWVARCTWDKERIKEQNANAKEKGEMKVLRYMNSENDFSYLLMGYDEVIPNVTKTVILVEGPFSKTATDKKLRLWERDGIKCLATFGKSLSPEQIEKLKSKGVEKIIILYDPDALDEIKKYLWRFDGCFNITGARLVNGDPDDVTTKELVEAIKNRRSPLLFNNDFLNKI
jgi:hypothetical protein